MKLKTFTELNWSCLQFLGERSRLKKDAIPTVFNFENKPSVSAISRKNRKQLYEECGHSDIEHVQNEVAPSTPFTEDKEDVHADMDTSVQCQLLTDQKCFISMFISNPKAIKYFIGFDDYDYF